MRGNTGADFEGEAIVIRGQTGFGLFSCFDFGRRKSNNNKYILIKGPFVFVYSKQTASAPTYSIPLKHQRVNVHDIKGNSQVVTLESGLGDIEYEFKFDLNENRELGANFGRVLEEEIVIGNTAEVKEVRYAIAYNEIDFGHIQFNTLILLLRELLHCQKLGHDTGFTKSFAYAKNVCDKKEKDQPEVSAPQSGADDYVMMQAY